MLNKDTPKIQIIMEIHGFVPLDMIYNHGVGGCCFRYHRFSRNDTGNQTCWALELPGSSMGDLIRFNGGTLVPYKAICWWDIPLHSPYIGLIIYGRYLQSRILKWSLRSSLEWIFPCHVEENRQVFNRWLSDDKHSYIRIPNVSHVCCSNLDFPSQKKTGLLKIGKW